MSSGRLSGKSVNRYYVFLFFEGVSELYAHPVFVTVGGGVYAAVKCSGVEYEYKVGTLVDAM